MFFELNSCVRCYRWKCPGCLWKNWVINLRCRYSSPHSFLLLMPLPFFSAPLTGSGVQLLRLVSMSMLSTLSLQELIGYLSKWCWTWKESSTRRYSVTSCICPLAGDTQPILPKSNHWFFFSRQILDLTRFGTAGFSNLESHANHARCENVNQGPIVLFFKN